MSESTLRFRITLNARRIYKLHKFKYRLLVMARLMPHNIAMIHLGKAYKIEHTSPIRRLKILLLHQEIFMSCYMKNLKSLTNH